MSAISFSLVGVKTDGSKTTLCVNVQPESEARRLVKSLMSTGDFERIDVVPVATPEPSIRKSGAARFRDGSPRRRSRAKRKATENSHEQG